MAIYCEDYSTSYSLVGWKTNSGTCSVVAASTTGTSNVIQITDITSTGFKVQLSSSSTSTVYAGTYRYFVIG